MWVEKYIGKKWTEKQDCGYWFREIQKNEFNRIVPVVCVNHKLPLDRVKAFKNKIPPEWQKTDNPKDGDAVFLAQRLRPHHIGVVVFINNVFYVLHALTSSNMILSDKFSLKINGWKIESFWTYGN